MKLEFNLTETVDLMVCVSRMEEENQAYIDKYEGTDRDLESIKTITKRLSELNKKLTDYNSKMISGMIETAAEVINK